jgi:hypothetical protein
MGMSSDPKKEQKRKDRKYALLRVPTIWDSRRSDVWGYLSSRQGDGNLGNLLETLNGVHSRSVTSR